MSIGIFSSEATNASGFKLLPQQETIANELLAKTIQLNNDIAQLQSTHPCCQLYTPNLGNVFFTRMWLYLLRAETSNTAEAVYCNKRSVSYTTLEVQALNDAEEADPNIFFPDPSGDSFCIRILHIKKGYAIFKSYKEQAPLHNLRHIPELGRHLTNSVRHHIDVYEMVGSDRKGIIICTSEVTEQLIPRTLGCIWSYLEVDDIGKTLREKTVDNSAFLQWAKMLYNNDLDTYYNKILELVAEREAYYEDPEHLKEAFQELQKSISEKQTANLDRKLIRVRKDITTLEEEIANRYKELRQCELEHVALLTSFSAVEETITELVTFLHKAKDTIRLLQKNEDVLTLEIKTPIGTFRRKDVALWYKHPESKNPINKFDDMALVFEKTFLDEEYDLILTTHIRLNIMSGTTSGVSDYRTLAGESVEAACRLGNPHIQRFDCFGAAKREIAKALTNNQYITAFAQIINACGTITFTDSIVVETLTSRLALADQDRPVFKRRSDGAMLSFKQVAAIEKAKIQTAEKEQFDTIMEAPAETETTDTTLTAV